MLHILAIFSRFRRLLCGIVDDRYYSLDLDVIGSGTTTTTSRMPSALVYPPRHRRRRPAARPRRARLPATPRLCRRSPHPPGTTSAAVSPAPGLTPISSTTQSPNPNVTLSPTATSKLPRFLQPPLARQIQVVVGGSTAFCCVLPYFPFHLRLECHQTGSENESGRGFGEAERSAPSAQELLAASPTEYDDDFAPGSPPSAFIHNGGGTARPRPPERHFSASTPPPSSSSSSNGHSHPNPHGNPELALARTPSRLGVSDGALANEAQRLADLCRISPTPPLLCPPPPRKSSSAHGHTSHSHHSTKKGGGDGGVTSKGGAKTSLLDKAVRYLLDGDAAPDRSTEEIWLMGVRLPGWGAEDEARVAAAAHVRASSAISLPLPLPAEVEGDPNAEEEDAPWPALFHAAFYAHVWCTYRAGFEPIRDLPSLGSLPPPLAFAGSPHAVSHSPSAHGSTSSVGREGMTSSGSTGTTLEPTSNLRRHAAQRDGEARDEEEEEEEESAIRRVERELRELLGSSYARVIVVRVTVGVGGVGESSGGSAGGLGRWVHSWRRMHSLTFVSHALTLITAVFERLQHEKEVVAPLPQQRNGWNERLDERRRVGMYVTDEPELARDGFGTEPPLHPTAPAPFPPPNRTAHALHARLISWFLDAPAAPFGVHRMALAGKAAGKDVGMWFGPSAAASALRMLVDAFPTCGLGVSVATDGTLYQNELRRPSPLRTDTALPPPHRGSSRGKDKESKGKEKRWGDRPVLLLLGIRLGLDGVNPIYYETVKRLYTFPQSVGIAGGRPSSSYYFVGVQGDGLFYLDPHHSRPAVPLRPFVGEGMGIPRSPGYAASPSSSSHGHASPSSSHGHAHGHAHERRSLSPEAAYARGGSTSPESASGSSFARGGSMSPELVYAHGHGRGGSMSPEFGYTHGVMTEDELVIVRPSHPSRTSSHTHASHDGGERERHPAGGPMGSVEEGYYARAYTAAEMRTFHCERVRKMPMSGLDPSMLLGFVCRDEAEWVDLRRRIKELPRTIFAIQDEPPTWPGADDDDDMLESISDPEEEADVGVDDGEVSTTSHAASSASHATSSASHVPASTFSHTHAHHGSNSTTHSASTSNSSNSGARSSEVDTEEDSVAPVTPLPNARFDLESPTKSMSKGGARTIGEAYAELEGEGEGEESFVDASEEMDDIEDDWVDPVPPPPPVPKKSASSSKDKDKEKEQERSGKKQDEGQEQEGDARAGAQRALSVPPCRRRMARAGRGGHRQGARTEHDSVAASSRGGGCTPRGRAMAGGRRAGARGILTED
ncbi:hypothetical protein MSAN_00279400 [Mycena sanguinolenta]|uniref:Autophagy-related protein 4 n=1 Tax=Mycena sanguinolenta TaxID=230812 RepID=A0A8H6ZGF5_9AGAR|nr:hypothetical protein MSAN_00279400 [Mycena sanguinolenta]